MNATHETTEDPHANESRWHAAIVEVLALVALFFVYAGDPAPAVNEAHYLVKAKNFWDPAYCSEDLFASSGKAHTTFYWTFGVLTQVVSLEATAWAGRLIGWLMLAIGLRRCCRSLGLPRYASLAVAVLWVIGIQYGNLAGEWVVGGIEAKVPAYAFVLIGFSEIARRHWSRAWIWFGAASAFHVLTGGWAVIASMVGFLVTERWKRPSDETSERFFSPGLFVGGALALFGLVPAVQLTLGATPEQSAEAAYIYSFVRIRHHLLPGDFPAHWFIRHGVLVASLIAVLLWKRSDASERRLLWIGVGAIGIACIGLVIGLRAEAIPSLAAKLLRYYWFRLSDAVVPLVLALVVAKIVFAGSKRELGFRLASGTLVVAVGLFVWTSYNRMQIAIPPSTSHRLLGVDASAEAERQYQSHSDWVAVCDWIRVSMPEKEVLLTPRHQQTFKWYSDRAEVVNWKDVPQDAESLLEWRRRFADVFPDQLGSVRLRSMRVPISYYKLREYREEYGVRFMVVDNRIATNSLPLIKVYPRGNQSNQTYSVYELPND